MIVNHNTHMTPRDLLVQIRKDRDAMAKLWDSLTEEQMTQRPGPQADWSVKDLIAHMTWWESFIMEGVTGLISGDNRALPSSLDRSARLRRKLKEFSILNGSSQKGDWWNQSSGANWRAGRVSPSGTTSVGVVICPLLLINGGFVFLDCFSR